MFSVERLEQHAESLAAGQNVAAKPERGQRLTPRVLENGRVLPESYRAIARAIQQEHRLHPPPNGWSITSTSPMSSSARSAATCPRAFIASCPSLLSVICRAIHAFGVAWAFGAHTVSRFDPTYTVRLWRADVGSCVTLQANPMKRTSNPSENYRKPPCFSAPKL